jgi:hypothetical protein
MRCVFDCLLNGRLAANSENVFCHFVGAIPDSTDLFNLLCRLLSKLSPVGHVNAVFFYLTMAEIC